MYVPFVRHPWRTLQADHIQLHRLRPELCTQIITQSVNLGEAPRGPPLDTQIATRTGYADQNSICEFWTCTSGLE